MKIKLFLLVVALLLIYFISIKFCQIQVQYSFQTNTVTTLSHYASKESKVQIEQNEYQSSTKQHSASIVVKPTTQSHSSLLDNTVTTTNTVSPSSHTNVLDGTTCSDHLCTQYLNELDVAMFRRCTRHLQKRGQNLINNGTCRFIDGTSHRKVALVSFPGSGNTWVRGLLEKATGICTGE